MKKHLGRLLIGLCTLALVLPAAAQDDAMDIALDHIRQLPTKSGMTGDDLADMKVQERFTSTHNGITHIYFRQQLNGLEVANAQISINVAADGRVINMKNSFVADLRTKAGGATPDLSAEDAIHAAADSLGYQVTGLLIPLKAASGLAQEARFSGAGLSLDEIPAKLAYFQTEDGSVRLAWDLVIRTVDHKHFYNVFVDAETGKELARFEWQHSDSYEVYAEPKDSPLDGGRTVEVDPADPTASPFGWHDTNGAAGAEFTVTRGNNVCAQTDRNGNNSACGTETQPDGGASLDFTGAVVPLDLATQQPSQYQDAAVANLFYWNNYMHDVLYRYGFDEASGNFQENNYGRGGSGSDSVNADAQDGSGTNNANFATPPDGSNPRMQMFEWTPPFVNELVVDAPSSAAGTYFGSAAEFGPTLASVSGSIVVADDGTGTASDGCEALQNGAQISGNVAFIDRGGCSFVTKVRSAQNAGASGVVVANNTGGNPITMGDDGTGGDITIPSMMISQADGATVQSGLPATGTAQAAANPPPNRDSDLDNGIIAHEYCHGLSIRLTGGAQTSNCLSGNQQAGEGWSDLCTLFFTAKASDQGTDAKGVGNYSIFEGNDGPGIRPFPYSTDLAINPQTYGDIVTAGQTGGLSIPHGVGTVWATAVWEMYWNLVDDQGFDADHINGTSGNNVAIQLMVDGLKLQGCNPTFLDARDGILAADQANNGGANECLIWEAFAKRGMGVNAQDGGNSNSLSVTENFDLPAQCVVGCGNGICESGEDCTSCPSDCPSGSSGATCGNGICEAADGENCQTCAADCNGQTGGKPANRFCCGFGDGLNPDGCGDSRCTSGGSQCTEIPATGGSFCCGDLICDAGESCSTCALDCTIGVEVCSGGIDEDCDGAVDCSDSECSGDPNCSCTVTENPEVSCSDGQDNDCDGLTDSSDPDCQGGQCADVGESCRDDIDCCSGSCSGGKPSSRVCLAS